MKTKKLSISKLLNYNEKSTVLTPQKTPSRIYQILSSLDKMLNHYYIIQVCHQELDWKAHKTLESVKSNL